MNVNMAQAVSFISAMGFACLASGMFLWQYGLQGLWLPLCATLGALIAMLVSQALFRRVMMGIASIVGGVLGGMVSGSAISRSDIPVGPYLVFVGAVLGAAIWVIRLGVPVFNKERDSRKLERTSEYLWVSVGSCVIGPALGAMYFLIEYLSGGIELVDKWPVLGYQIGGAIGALLCAVSFGATGGLLVGIPYLMAWWIQAGQKRVTADNDSHT